MAWYHQATSHYLNQCLPRSMSPYGVIVPQWVGWLKDNCKDLATWMMIYIYIYGHDMTYNHDYYQSVGFYCHTDNNIVTKKNLPAMAVIPRTKLPVIRAYMTFCYTDRQIIILYLPSYLITCFFVINTFPGWDIEGTLTFLQCSHPVYLVKTG